MYDHIQRALVFNGFGEVKLYYFHSSFPAELGEGLEIELPDLLLAQPVAHPLPLEEGLHGAGRAAPGRPGGCCCCCCSHSASAERRPAAGSAPPPLLLLLVLLLLLLVLLLLLLLGGRPPRGVMMRSFSETEVDDDEWR